MEHINPFTIFWVICIGFILWLLLVTYYITRNTGDLLNHTQRITKLEVDVVDIQKVLEYLHKKKNTTIKK